MEIKTFQFNCVRGLCGSLSFGTSWYHPGHSNIPTSIPKGCQEEKEEQGLHPSSLPVVLTKCSKWPPILEEDVQERNQKKGSLRRTRSLCLPVTYRVALLCSRKRGPSCFLGFIQTQRCFWVNKVVLGYEWMNTPIRAARGKRDIYWLGWKQLIFTFNSFSSH